MGFQDEGTLYTQSNCSHFDLGSTYLSWHNTLELVRMALTELRIAGVRIFILEVAIEAVVK